MDLVFLVEKKYINSIKCTNEDIDFYVVAIDSNHHNDSNNITFVLFRRKN